MPDEVENIQGAIAPDSEERKAFIKGLVDNGQAAKPLPDGSLPPGATHEIIGEAANGLPIVKRRRFSARCGCGELRDRRCGYRDTSSEERYGESRPADH